MYGRTTYPCSAPVLATIPFASQTVCVPVVRTQKTSMGYRCPVVIPDSIQAQAESSRIASKVKSVFMTAPASANCEGNSGSNQSNVLQSTTPVTPGAPIPYAPVGAPAASFTVANRAAQAVAISVNPFNPKTRFSQYFPPPPMPYCPPVRYVKADTLPSVNTCRPIQRFTGIPAAAAPPPQ